MAHERRGAGGIHPPIHPAASRRRKSISPGRAASRRCSAWIFSARPSPCRRNSPTAKTFPTPSRPTARCSTTNGANFSRQINFSSGFPLTARRNCTITTAWTSGSSRLSARSCAGWNCSKSTAWNSTRSLSSTARIRSSRWKFIVFSRASAANSCSSFRWSSAPRRPEMKSAGYDFASAAACRTATSALAANRHAVERRGGAIRQFSLRDFRRVGAARCGQNFRAIVRRGAGQLDGPGLVALRLRGKMRRGAGHRTQRRPLQLRPLRLSAPQPRQRHEPKPRRDGEFAASR